MGGGVGATATGADTGAHADAISAVQTAISEMQGNLRIGGDDSMQESAHPEPIHAHEWRFSTSRSKGRLALARLRSRSGSRPGSMQPPCSKNARIRFSPTSMAA